MLKFHYGFVSKMYSYLNPLGYNNWLSIINLSKEKGLCHEGYSMPAWSVTQSHHLTLDPLWTAGPGPLSMGERAQRVSCVPHHKDLQQ